jgi:hypothetical protein
MALSREFLTVSGQEPGADGTGMPMSKKIWDFAFFLFSVHITRCGTAGSILPLLAVVMFLQPPATIR